MTIDDGVAYGEPFQKASASLRFDGAGVRLDSVSLAKATGTVTGAAFVGWDGTYSFNVDGRRIPAERVAAFEYPKAQPAGLIDFTATGSSTFAEPRYDVRFRMNGLTVAAEPVGLVTGTLALRGREVSGELEASSDTLALTGTGRIQLDGESDADLTFRFHGSSLEPYVRLFVPRLSPYTKAVSGTIRVGGGLRDVQLYTAGARQRKGVGRRLELAAHFATAQRQRAGHETHRSAADRQAVHPESYVVARVGKVLLPVAVKSIRPAGCAFGYSNAATRSAGMRRPSTLNE